jgi:3D (Asp-Asp-Asp) domain-containing protein
MKWLIALLLAAILILILPMYASSSKDLAPWCVDRGPVGISYPKPELNPSKAIIEPRTQVTYENPCSLPKEDRKSLSFKAVVTAYNSVPEQTDGDPCIAADGTDICEALRRGEGTCAANCLPFGSVLDIPGLGACVVRDRTASRYGSRIDLYLGGRDQIKAAKTWGIKKGLIVTIIK